MAVDLYPMPGYALMKLAGKYKNVSAETKSYEGATSGVLISVSLHTSDDPDIAKKWQRAIYKTVYWSEHVSGHPITEGRDRYVFIRADLIEGYQVAKSE